MFSLLRAIGSPLRLDDDAANQPVRTLNAVLLVAILGLSLGGVLMLLIAPETLYPGAVYLGLVVFLLALYGLMRRGYVRLVSIVMIGGFWTAATITNALLGGVQSPVAGAYGVLIVLAALLLGPTAGIGMAVINILALLVFFWLELPARDLGEHIPVVLEVSHYILTAGFLYIATSALSQAYRHVPQALQDLQETSVSKNYVNNILQSMSNLLFVLDPNGSIRTVNHAALDLLGYTEDELIGQPFHRVVTSGLGDLPTMQRNIEQQYRASDGRLIPVRVSTAVMRDENRAIMGVVCVAQDETERLKAEAQVHYQASLLENVSDAIIATTLDLTITSWNKAAETVYGWAAAEVIGKNLQDIVKTVYGNDEPESYVKQQYLARGHWRSEVMQRRKDGTPLHILSSVSVLRDSTGQPSGIVSVNHDITQRKAAEIELRQRADQLATLQSIEEKISSTLDISAVLNQALQEAAAVSAADHGFILVRDDEGTRMIHRYGGYEVTIPPEEYQVYGVTARVMKNQTAELVMDVTQDPDYAPDQPDTRALMAIPLISSERALGVMVLETSRDGAFSPEVFDFIKILAGRIAAAVDNARLYQIARRQLLEITELYQRVSSLEQLKTDMIRIASHDLRSPIGLINGYLELIRDDVFDRLTEGEKDYIESIASAVGRMQSIVQDILSLERIQEMVDHAFEEEVNLTQLIQRAMQTLRHEAAMKTLSLQLELPGEPVFVRGDGVQLYEVIANLVSNAIKYSPEAGKPITISLRREQGQAVLAVRDSGYGVPDDQQARLFQPFFRAKSRETEEIEGVGLGLHLVKNIIERHQGTIIFESKYGKGSTFGFRLPLAGQ